MVILAGALAGATIYYAIATCRIQKASEGAVDAWRTQSEVTVRLNVVIRASWAQETLCMKENTVKHKAQLLLVILFAAMSLLGCNGVRTITTDTTLTADHNGQIVIGADGITLDGNGYVIRGCGTGNGIKLVSRTGVTIKNCIVTNFDDGIQLNGSHDNVFRNNKVHHNTNEGFDIEGSDRNTFRGNTSEDNGRDGFDMEDSEYNEFINNEATGNGTSGSGGNGVELDRCSNNTFTGNTSSNNLRNGFSLDDSPDNDFEENTADNNGRRGFQIETSDDNTFSDNDACGNSVDDARQQGCTGNVFCGNTFCTTDGIPAGYDSPCP